MYVYIKSLNTLNKYVNSDVVPEVCKYGTMIFYIEAELTSGKWGNFSYWMCFSKFRIGDERRIRQ